MATLIKASTGAAETVAPANGKAFTLAELQGFVGGFIELLRLADGRLMWINEDGKRLELPSNPVADHLARKAGIAPWDWVVGDVLIATPEESGDGDEEDEQ